MRFKSEAHAYRYWQEAYSLSGDVAPLDRREDLFNDWVDDQAVSWLDEDTQEFIRTFEEDYHEGMK